MGGAGVGVAVDPLGPAAAMMGVAAADDLLGRPGDLADHEGVAGAVADVAEADLAVAVDDAVVGEAAARRGSRCSLEAVAGPLGARDAEVMRGVDLDGGVAAVVAAVLAEGGAIPEGDALVHAVVDGGVRRRVIGP